MRLFVPEVYATRKHCPTDGGCGIEGEVQVGILSDGCEFDAALTSFVCSVKVVRGVDWYVQCVGSDILTRPCEFLKRVRINVLDYLDKPEIGGASTWWVHFVDCGVNEHAAKP